MKIVADSHIPYVREYFSAYGDLILKGGRTITAEDVKEADILLVRSITHVDEKLLSGSKVKFVGSVTAGADHLDTAWLRKAGIEYSVAVGFNAPPVADYVVSVIAGLQRKKILANPLLKRQVKTAVVGVGNVGRLVVERLKLLNFDVVLCDPLRAKKEADFASVPLEELHDLDLITFHVPLTKESEYKTYHFIDKTFLQRQKAGCVLLNASRGSIINTKDLLQYGSHLHWCFDVWEHEPKLEKAVLEQALIATPHIAGYSVQSKMRGIDMIYRIVCEKKIIAPQTFSPITFPYQTLTFAGANHHWQDILLGVFNPLIITAMMRTMLLPADDYAHLFDEMRNQFNYRYEFGFTRISAEGLAIADQALLRGMGLIVDPNAALI